MLVSASVELVRFMGAPSFRKVTGVTREPTQTSSTSEGNISASTSPLRPEDSKGGPREPQITCAENAEISPSRRAGLTGIVIYRLVHPL